MRTVLAFIKRDFLMATSYKASFAAQIGAVAVKVTIFYFLVAVFERAGTSMLKDYGGNYFAFILIGVAFWDYLAASLTTFNTSMRDSQMMGTLEIMILAPIKLSTMLISSALWSYLFVSLRFALFLGLGVLVFGMDVGNANVPGGFLVLVASIVCFASIGIAMASVIITFKQGDPRRFVTLTSVILGGVFFPVSMLPDWLRQLSSLVPMTHSLNAMRHSLLDGYTLSQLWPDIMLLTVFTLILLPLGLLSFSLAVQRAKANGTLAHY